MTPQNPDHQQDLNGRSHKKTRRSAKPEALQPCVPASPRAGARTHPVRRIPRSALGPTTSASRPRRCVGFPYRPGTVVLFHFSMYWPWRSGSRLKTLRERERYASPTGPGPPRSNRRPARRSHAATRTVGGIGGPGDRAGRHRGRPGAPRGVYRSAAHRDRRVHDWPDSRQNRTEQSLLVRGATCPPSRILTPALPGRALRPPPDRARQAIGCRSARVTPPGLHVYHTRPAPCRHSSCD